MTKTVVIAGEPIAVDVVRTGDRITGTADGHAVDAAIDRDGDTWRLKTAGETVALTVVRDRDAVWVAVDGEVYRCVVSAAGGAAGAAAGSIHSPHVVAPMPGKVLEVRVREGQDVAAGDPLVVLEAMKMETVATADAAGRVTKVHVTEGTMVEPGQALVDLELA